MYNYSLKIKIFNNKAFFGPGAAELLDRIDKTGSLKVACEEMKLSYTKGRRIIKDIENETGKTIVIFKHGGVGGGNAVLTDDAYNILRQYKEFINEVGKKADELFKLYYGDDK